MQGRVIFFWLRVSVKKSLFYSPLRWLQRPEVWLISAWEQPLVVMRSAANWSPPSFSQRGRSGTSVGRLLFCFSSQSDTMEVSEMQTGCGGEEEICCCSNMEGLIHCTGGNDLSSFSSFHACIIIVFTFGVFLFELSLSFLLLLLFYFAGRFLMWLCLNVFGHSPPFSILLI